MGQLGRTLLFGVHRDEINPAELALLQRSGAAGHLPAFWRGVVQALAQELYGRGEEAVRDRLTALITADDENLPGHNRTVGALWLNRIGWLMLFTWLCQAGYISSAEADNLNRAHLDARRRLADKQQAAQADEWPASIFLNVLREMLATGEAIIFNAETEAFRQLSNPGKYHPPQPEKIIGFVHEHGIALYPGTAYRIISDWRNRQRQALNYSDGAIWQLGNNAISTVVECARVVLQV